MSQIQASGQRIEYFEKLQLQCKFTGPLRIPLHSNIRWGSAHRMLERSYKLRQPINLFLQSADTLYGPITTIRRNGRIEKKIPWSVFALTDQDWERVADARDILKVNPCPFYRSETTDKCNDRIQTTSKSYSRPNSSPRCGVHFPRSRNCRPLGKISGNQIVLSCTSAPLMPDWQNSKSTIRGLTPSPFSSSRLVRSFFLSVSYSFLHD